MEGQGVISGWRSDGHVMEVVFRVTMVVVMVVEGLLMVINFVVMETAVIVVVVVVVEKLISLIVELKLFCTFLDLEINS